MCLSGPDNVTIPSADIVADAANHGALDCGEARSLQKTQLAAPTFAPQGQSTLHDYIDYGSPVVQERLQQYEARTVQAFISGLNEKYRQMTLWHKLDEVGWTWQNAEDEIRRMVKDGKRRPRDRRVTKVPNVDDD